MGFNDRIYQDDDCENYIYDSDIDRVTVLLAMFFLFAVLCLVLHYSNNMKGVNKP